MKFLLQFLAGRKRFARERDFYEGFNWMAGELLRGEKTADELEDMHHKTMWSRTAFDDGVIDALRKWRARR